VIWRSGNIHGKADGVKFLPVNEHRVGKFNENQSTILAIGKIGAKWPDFVKSV
jgi:hypothetical protein